MAGLNENRKSFESKGTANYGVDYITDTALHSGKWYAMLVIQDCTIASVSATVFGNSGTLTDLSGESISAGTFMPLPHCTSIQLTSGKVAMIRAQDY